jgi:hypothetical protein
VETPSLKRGAWWIGRRSCTPPILECGGAGSPTRRRTSIPAAKSGPVAACRLSNARRILAVSAAWDVRGSLVSSTYVLAYVAVGSGTMSAHDRAASDTSPWLNSNSPMRDSFISQRDDRIEPSRLPGRPDACGNGDDNHHEGDHHNRQRIAGARLHEQALQEPADAERARHPDR